MTAVDGSQFLACYASFPDPLFFQTAAGVWHANPAADALNLSPSEFKQLAAWDGTSSIWLAGRFFYVHGHRTDDGTFLLLSPDSFFSSVAINLSSQLRQRVSSAFNGISTLKEHLPSDTLCVNEDLAEVSRALFQILHIVMELERSTESELSCQKVCLELTQWLERLTNEMRHWFQPEDNVTLRLDLPSTPLAAMADSHFLDCLVTHLVSNAIKAAPKGKAEVCLDLKKDGSSAVLRIIGNGDAFSPAILKEPLWNQPTRLLPGRGLGLGLPIAQRIAEIHGGTLMATQAEDRSQMVLSLPLCVPEGQLCSPKSPIDPFYSPVRAILSSVLSTAAFHPDIGPPPETP